MELMMLFGNEVVDRIKVNTRKAKTPAYLIDLEETLIARNEEDLNFSSDAPQFMLESVRSGINSSSGVAFL